ncbi:hypothetical protein BVZ75_00086 [Haemophilus influenzae]|nr:hypothetical protein BVZ75_00086 [Haemophilus influenzae]
MVIFPVMRLLEFCPPRVTLPPKMCMLWVVLMALFPYPSANVSAVCLRVKFEPVAFIVKSLLILKASFLRTLELKVKLEPPETLIKLELILIPPAVVFASSLMLTFPPPETEMLDRNLVAVVILSRL